MYIYMFVDEIKRRIVRPLPKKVAKLVVQIKMKSGAN